MLAPLQEHPRFLDSELITYLGNKRALLPFIGEGVAQVQARMGGKKLRFADVFAGSGVVSRYMKAYASHITCNDLETYTAAVNGCYLANAESIDQHVLKHALKQVKEGIAQHPQAGFIAELYAPADDAAILPGERVFYTRRNAAYIDSARQHIAKLPSDLQPYLLGPLLVGASIHTNTAGVFKGFYKNRQGVGAFGGAGGHAQTRIRGEIALHLPTLSRFNCEVIVSQQDALAFARQPCEYDLAYLDPPYNQHPYGSNYFMLNLIARYERPSSISPVSGIPPDWARSPFNKPKQAAEALFAVMDALPARFQLISYNSEGFIKKAAFIEGLQARGHVTLLETRYNAYRGSRNLKNRNPYVSEYLFLLEKR